MNSIFLQHGIRTAAVLLVSLAAASTAMAQSGSVLEHMAEMHAEADEFHFFDDERKQVIDYQTAREVRICTGESRHMVPLKVTYDEQTAKLGSNDCIRVEAKNVYLEPMDRLEPNWVITAEVETS